MCNHVDIECTLNGRIIEVQQRLSTDHTGIVDDHGHFACLLFRLKEKTGERR